MTHGQPDYGAYAAKKTIGSMADNAELAARLGSIVTFDRRGDLVWLDDFESGISKWVASTLGVNAYVRQDSHAARNGGFSIRLNTGNLANNWAHIEHGTPYPVTSRVGFEISFTAHGGLGVVTFTQRLDDGNFRHYARLRYSTNTQLLEYWDNTPAWRTLAANVSLLIGRWIFHTIKFVIDLSTQRYVRAILNSVEYDMSALSYEHTGLIIAPQWMQMVEITTGLNNSQHAYFDDAIVTQNEP